ncbi:hypothetical protein [Parageobacillus thermantarcticus]|uniref:hypothetical protein n=1 Tax=Parageobacillus thermantarcticus TaxID=186116 RepID=UPI00116031A2|nr:hypothetical protein [Parageobacillus thermantarcticus]
MRKHRRCPGLAAAQNRRQASVSADPGFHMLRSAKSFSEFRYWENPCLFAQNPGLNPLPAWCRQQETGPRPVFRNASLQQAETAAWAWAPGRMKAAFYALPPSPRPLAIYFFG